MTLSAGTRLGPFEVLAPLGAGGMGEVYRARDTRLSRDVAIKVLPVELSSDAARLKRFEKEALGHARFASDGQTIVYDAAWDGRPHEVFTVHRDGSEPHSFGEGASAVLAVSSQLQDEATRKPRSRSRPDLLTA
jgi:serine/threonine protein kinase